MKQIQTIVDIYSTVDELIAELKRINQVKLAETLYHRMHIVAWTSSSELHEELQNIFTKLLQNNDIILPESLINQIQQMIQVILNPATTE
jgi:hypothetical protein